MVLEVEGCDCYSLIDKLSNALPYPLHILDVLLDINVH